MRPVLGVAPCCKDWYPKVYFYKLNNCSENQEYIISYEEELVVQALGDNV